MIHGMLKQYFCQNSNREDYWKNAMLLQKAWLAKRYNRPYLYQSTQQDNTTVSKTKKKPAQVQTTQEDTSLSKMVILHQEYHSHWHHP